MINLVTRGRRKIHGDAVNADLRGDTAFRGQADHVFFGVHGSAGDAERHRKTALPARHRHPAKDATWPAFVEGVTSNEMENFDAGFEEFGRGGEGSPGIWASGDFCAVQKHQSGGLGLRRLNHAGEKLAVANPR